MVLGEGENFFSREKKFSPSPNPNPFQEKRSIWLRKVQYSIGDYPPNKGTETFQKSGVLVEGGTWAAARGIC